MSSETQSVSINILEREYQISCPPSEEEALRKSANYLDKQMKKVKASGSSLGFEKLAVMTALNLSHELLGKYQSVSDSETDSLHLLKKLEDKIDLALLASRQIDI